MFIFFHLLALFLVFVAVEGAVLGICMPPVSQESNAHTKNGI